MIYIVLLVVVSLVVGVYLIRRSTASAAGTDRARDRVRLPFSDRILPIVETWAAANSYSLTETTEAARTYQTKTRGTGMPVFLRIERIGDEYELQSWVVASGLGGGGGLALAAPGFILAMPRKQARGAHNLLRAELGLPALG